MTLSIAKTEVKMSDYFEIGFLDIDSDKSGDAISMRYKIGSEVKIHIVDGGFQRYYLSATDILFNALNKLRDQDRAYTHVIIDCPPSLGLVTLNGLSMSNYYIVPTFLDAYSHWGLDKIIERVDTLKRCKASCEAELLGILYSKVDSQSTTENDRWRKEFSEWEAAHKRRFLKFYNRGIESIVFDTEIMKVDIIRKAEAAHRPLIAFDPEGKLKQERDKRQQEWHNVSTEICDRIEALKPKTNTQVK